MNKDIVWKEAKSNRDHWDESDEEPDEQEEQENEVIEDEDISNDGDDQDDGESKIDAGLDDRDKYSDSQQNRCNIQSDSDDNFSTLVSNTFSHKQIDLKLRRNIIDLAEAAKQQKSKPNHSINNEQFSGWLENALVAISPSADFVLFAAQSPERLIFYARLRMEPIDQYSTKELDIPLDYDEHITSLLCLPLMSTQRTSMGAVDWTALVIGLSSGYVKFYTEKSVCLLSLKFCDEPVISLKCQTQKNIGNARSQTHFASMVDEMLVTYLSTAIVIDGIGLYENLRISKEDVIKNGANYEPAYSLKNLPTILTCQKWRLNEGARGSKSVDADLFGMRCTTRFDSLRSDSINLDQHTPIKACTRTLAIVGRNPFISCYQEARETTTHSYTEIIGSLLPFWSKPQPTKTQINEVTNPGHIGLFDKGRLATTIVSSPDKRLAIVTDDFGRVMLVDVTNWLVVRIWKGYRSAQCGWIETKRNPEERGSPCASFLVIYAPKRGLLEIWSAQRGPRVAAFNVGRGCRLLYSGYKMFNMRAESSAKVHSSSSSSSSAVNLLIDESYSSNCYLLNPKLGTVFTIELPYTYSLYKYGDLRSRDHLLLGELTGAIQQDLEVKMISEIIHRIVLAESLHISIQKVAHSLLNPEKIVPIMENLVNKTMKNYDNDSGEMMTDDDSSIVEVCKRLIRLCSMYTDLMAKSAATKGKDCLSLPDVNQRRLIDEYEEHPQEVDELADQLGWTAGEVLRYLSLLALDRSYRKNHIQDPWPNMGEPLTWLEFISCFDLSPSTTNNNSLKRNKKQQTGTNLVNDKNVMISSIKLKACDSKFLNQDKVIKTALFLYNKLSESFYRSSKLINTSTSNNQSSDSCDLLNAYSHIEPSSRLALLIQFWLSTKLCNHWKMWAFLQHQLGRISDELKVIAAMTQNEQDDGDGDDDDDDDKDDAEKNADDSVLIEIWRQIYQLILESDNIYAAIIATAAIRSDTLKTIEDSEKKREKLKKQDDEIGEMEGGHQSPGSNAVIDWECLCIDAERMSILSQQLEDVFLLNLLLRYSVKEGHLTSSGFVYKLPRISVANVLRSGPTIVTELVAQWAVQSGIDMSIFTRSYGDNNDQEASAVLMAASNSDNQSSTAIGRRRDYPSSRWLSSRTNQKMNNQEHAEELLHHTRTSFPYSLEPSVILLNCVWEFCRRWTSSTTSSSDKAQLLNGAYQALTKLYSVILRHNLASVAYKTFFQRTFERLALLVETNVAFLSNSSSKSSHRLRDGLTRKELNMAEESLESFIEFCCNLSEFMLQTCKDATTTGDANPDDEQSRSTTATSERSALAEQRSQLLSQLSTLDDWWSTPDVLKDDDQQLMMAGQGNSCKYYSSIRRISTSSGSMTSDIMIQQQMNDEQQQQQQQPFSLVRASLSFDNLLNVNTLVELNRLANLMNLIFKLRISKAYPLTLIGEESRQILQFDLQQSPGTGADMKTRSGSLAELRQKFARKCIVSIVSKLSDNHKNEITEDEYGYDLSGILVVVADDDEPTTTTMRASEDIDTKVSAKKQSLSQKDLFVNSSSKQNRRRHQSRQAKSCNNNTNATSSTSTTAAANSNSSRRDMMNSVANDDDDDGNNIDSSDVGDYIDGQTKSYVNDASDDDDDDDDDHSSGWMKDENNELLALFTNLLSLANEWQLDCDELHLEFVFELYRCNHDKIAQQISTRIQDRQTLANGLLKISSQRVLAMFGLSPQLSELSHWKKRIDKWSMFQPNVSSWLKVIQQEEMRREIASLSFSSSLKPTTTTSSSSASVHYGREEDEDKLSADFINSIEHSLGLQLFVLNAIGVRTKLVLESVTNHLDGQAGRLAYDLLQLLESRLFDRFLLQERKLWLKQHGGDGAVASGEATNSAN